MQVIVMMPKEVILILRHVFAAQLIVPPIRTVMRGMACATNILLVPIKTVFVSYHTNVPAEVQLVALVRFVRVITMTVRILKSVIIEVIRLLLEQIVCVLMEKTVIFVPLGNGVQQ